MPHEQMCGRIRLQLMNFNGIITADARIIWCSTTRVGVAFATHPPMVDQAIPWLPDRQQEIDCETKMTTVTQIGNGWLQSTAEDSKREPYTDPASESWVEKISESVAWIIRALTIRTCFNQRPVIVPG